MQQMICGNTQAEIDRDTQTSYQEQAQYEWEAKRWRMAVSHLLHGKNVHAEDGRVYSLEESMAEEYPEFSTLIDMGFDFIGAYKNGDLEPSIRNLIETQAKKLATKIVGCDYE